MSKYLTWADHSKLAIQAGLEWFDYQNDAFRKAAKQPTPLRACLYYRTGAGKTLTALALVKLSGENTALVIAPPATHGAWRASASLLNMRITTVSHAKFRQKHFQVSRTQPIIADEFHLFGGYTGKGWPKFNRVAKALKLPIVIASATPNYNDAERCFCIQSVLDPQSVKGGYLEFIYKNCHTKQNPFGITPLVEGFLHYADAAAYLAALPGVYYIPDLSTLEPIELEFAIPLPDEFTEYGLDNTRERIMASVMETTQRKEFRWRVDDDGRIRTEIMEILKGLIAREDKVLIFATRATIAKILYEQLILETDIQGSLITGKMSKATKLETLQQFKEDPNEQVLIGTATIATGVDGLDKVCDTLVLFDDTNDNSLRRQIIGRILPRGKDSDESMKTVWRYTFY